MTARTHRPRTAETTETTETSQAAPEVGAFFDTGGHIGLGDAVDGEDVVVSGVAFTAGEISALVDFVGAPSALFEYAHTDVVAIRNHLDQNLEDRAALESVAFWDPITEKYGVPYSTLAQANEDHFAPGEAGGPNYATSFVDQFAEALRLMQSAAECDDEQQAAQTRNLARAVGYGAEHYLQDAYSAGHQVGAGDVGAAVDEILGLSNFEEVVHGAGTIVFVDHAPELAHWRVPSVLHPVYGSPIDSLAEWQSLVELGGLAFGRESVRDGVRQEVHERLAESPVWVTSELHPEPFSLGGDHAPAPESAGVLAKALEHVRDLLANPTPQSPEAVAAAAWARVRTTPTTDTAVMVKKTISDCTRNEAELIRSVANAMGRTLPDILAGFEAKGLVWRGDGSTPEQPAPAPEQPAPAPEQPAPTPQPEAPQQGAPGGWVGWAQDFDADRDDPWVQSR